MIILELIETKHDLTFDGAEMAIEGELVPVATVNMEFSSRPIFFEHHILL